MRTQFPLFQSHLDLAHRYWEELVCPGDLVIDATCGNGHDTLKLCHLALCHTKGNVYALDIQPEAIESTRSYLTYHLSTQQLLQVHFHLGCHSQFPKDIQPETVKLIVYNLGYLPGGDKIVTTQAQTTLRSLQQASELIQPGGAISVTCYPGHPAGAIEEEAILHDVLNLPATRWSCCHHRWLNRKQAPSLLILQKAKN